MKKISALFLLSTFLCCGMVSARTIYDSNGKIMYDATIRGQKRAAAQQIEIKTVNTAAAAKINYNSADKLLESRPMMQSNYYQDKVGVQKAVNKALGDETPMQSNYYQDRIQNQK